MAKVSNERNTSLPNLCTNYADLESANAALSHRRPRYEIINPTESIATPSPVAYYCDQGKHSYVAAADNVEIDFNMSVEDIRKTLDTAFENYFAPFERNSL